MRQRVESRDRSDRRGNETKYRGEYDRDDYRSRHGSGHSSSFRRDQTRPYNTGGYYSGEREFSCERPGRPDSREYRPEFPDARFIDKEPLPKLQKLSAEVAQPDNQTEAGTTGLQNFLSSKFKNNFRNVGAN